MVPCLRGELVVKRPEKYSARRFSVMVGIHGIHGFNPPGVSGGKRDPPSCHLSPPALKTVGFFQRETPGVP